MELQQDSIIVSDRLQALFDFELRNCFTHAFVTDGECVMKYSGEEVRMEKGDCVIIIANHLVTEIQPTENFRAKVIFIEPGFMEACTPHTSYGIVGGMSLFITPVMHLNERDQWLCEHDFDEIIRRILQPHQSFQGDAVMAATQMMFCDFYEFHAHLYGQPEISALTASVMKRFIDLLERGDYRRNRDVAYYADKLCVTPKYLSEVSKKLSGRTAGFWIDRYATIALTRLLRDKRLSRNHRAFGGFSMGSVCTWWTFTKALDLFRYYIPTSGDCWALGTQAGRSNPTGTAEYLAAAVTEQNYTSRDFFIHVMTGSDDIAEPMLTPQTEAMKQLPQFSFGTDKRQHNFYYAVLPGATHTSSYAFQYAYNALLHLWKNEPDSDDTTGIKPVKM